MYHDYCIGCETSGKSRELTHRRLRKKAIGTRRRHGVKLSEQGVIKDPEDLEGIYGWSLDRMIAGIGQVITEGCPYCQEPIDIVEHGLGIVTLDIFNPDLEPHYSTNVRWCCVRCNAEKQRITPALWGARLSMWRLWRRNQVLLQGTPEVFGFLPLRNDEDPSPTLF